MSDLLNKLGSKPNAAEGSGQSASEPRQSAQAVVSSETFNRGDDLLAKTVSKKPETKAATTAQTQASSAESGQSPTASSTEEPTGGIQTNDDWSKDSALKEVKKLREENKAYRLKYADQVQEMQKTADERIKQKEAEVQSLLKAKDELDRIKAEQEDKKRDLSEKIAHREAKLAETSAIFAAREKEYQDKLNKYESIVNQFQAERQAEAQVYQARLQEELEKVPEKFKEYANLLVKGAGDPRDGAVALAEAKLRGMFEDKTVVVNHSVPGAHDGARSSKERLEQAEKDRRGSMNSSQKIGEALKSIKQGTPNTAFRLNK